MHVGELLAGAYEDFRMLSARAVIISYVSTLKPLIRARQARKSARRRETETKDISILAQVLVKACRNPQYENPRRRVLFH